MSNLSVEIPRRIEKATNEFYSRFLIYLSASALAICSYAYRSEINQMLMAVQNYLRLNFYYQYYEPDRYKLAQEDKIVIEKMNTDQKRTAEVLKIVEDQRHLIESRGWEIYYDQGIDKKAVASTLKFRNESGPKKLFASSSVMLYRDTRTSNNAEYLMIIASGHQITKMNDYSPKNWHATFIRDSIFPNSGEATIASNEFGLATSIIKEGKRQDVGVLAMPIDSAAGRKLLSIIDLNSILKPDDISYSLTPDKERITGVCFAGSTTDSPLVEIAQRRTEQSYLDFGMFNVDNMHVTSGICGCLGYNSSGKVIGVFGNAINPVIYPEGADNGLMTLFADMAKDQYGNLVLFNQAIDNIPNK